MKKLILYFLLLALVIVFPTCGGGSSSNNGGSSGVPVTSVSLKASAIILVNETEQLTATITPANATNQNLTWKSSDDTKATVSANGLVNGIKKGIAVITVTSEDGSFQAACNVTVDSIGVIDISHNGTQSYSFGYRTDNQAKRFQTFIADYHTILDGVEVKIQKNNGTQIYNNISVELYETSAGLPTTKLAETTMDVTSLGTVLKVMRAELKYQNLVPGTEYAIVLGQVNLDTVTTNGFSWCTKQVSSELDFGKLEGSTWTDESVNGDGWLKVYVYGADYSRPYAWSDPGNGVDDVVYSIAIDSIGNVYASGNFITTGSGITVNRIAMWNGTSWSALGTGMDVGTVRALAIDSHNNLYACGNFSTAGGVAASAIAKWDGTTWSALGNGLVGSVSALAIDSNDNLYVGGYFTETYGGLTVNRVAKWDGTSWSALGTGMNDYVNALAVDSNNNLYASGNFTTAGGTAVNYIARWDGTSWSALGDGMNDRAYVLAVDSHNNLYAGGWFTTAGGNTVNHIAKWDGTTWSALDTGMNDIVTALAVDSADNLYAGGNFTTTGGGNPLNCLARWNGTSWSILGAGVNSSVFALAVDPDDNIFAGGYLTNAGGTTVNRMARWGR
ncbi:MAG: Ig-like domain-containing protein [Spirochaetota bacterium]